MLFLRKLRVLNDGIKPSIWHYCRINGYVFQALWGNSCNMMHRLPVLPTAHEYLKRKCVSPLTALDCELKFYGRGRRISQPEMPRRRNYLQVLILSDQLLPGKNLISLDAFKAVLSLFILKNKVEQFTRAPSFAASFTNTCYQWATRNSTRMGSAENSGISHLIKALNSQSQAPQLNMILKTGFLSADWLIKSLEKRLATVLGKKY